jgi:hypothetical protein
MKINFSERCHERFQRIIALHNLANLDIAHNINIRSLLICNIPYGIEQYFSLFQLRTTNQVEFCATP